MTVEWVEITKDNLFNLEMVMELYDLAFPIEIREPHSVFLKSLQYAKTRSPNNYHFLIGLEGDQLVSFATGHYFAEVNSGFIVYIVTNPLVRSNGLGSKTLVKLEDLLIKDAITAGNSSLKSILLETETQDIVHTEEEKEDCIKRNRFFARNYYKKYEEIIYRQPPLHDEVGDIPLNLFIKNLDSIKQSKEDVKKAIRTIYKEKYFLVNGIDKKVLINCLEKMGIEDTY
ncbi:GNAT family N-acetyltransferase [Fictibacillus nanhaiensis]|uniref:GNAT family N-acetyltransferase n=1 Tax=Fictibacillus nanhaiensis TaxID=742169 RepID=UPI001C970F53|nr:GNAT family N-acetyltransferase [Fictibacillus nanhaiensis]MBY6036978.1 GNAT family N-acetyltransferase [Fictibacillus nanhaiensis]